LADVTVRNAESLCEFQVADFARFIKLSDLSDHFSADSRLEPSVKRMTAFGYRIPVVVQIGPKKKMGGTYTKRIIASVADTGLFWNWTHIELIRESMSLYLALCFEVPVLVPLRSGASS
jgi:hypothetical protein